MNHLLCNQCGANRRFLQRAFRRVFGKRSPQGGHVRRLNAWSLA